MPGSAENPKNERVTTVKKLKQAQLPFKIFSPTVVGQQVCPGKSHAIKKRPFARDEQCTTKATESKKAKKSSLDSDCGEVSSSSDEPRPSSPRWRPRASLDQFVRVEPPAPEVTTSGDLVNLLGDDKENRAEQPPAQVGSDAGTPTQELKKEAGVKEYIARDLDSFHLKAEKSGKLEATKSEGPDTCEARTQREPHPLDANPGEISDPVEGQKNNLSASVMVEDFKPDGMNMRAVNDSADILQVETDNNALTDLNSKNSAADVRKVEANISYVTNANAKGNPVADAVKVKTDGCVVRDIDAEEQDVQVKVVHVNTHDKTQTKFNENSDPSVVDISQGTKLEVGVTKNTDIPQSGSEEPLSRTSSPIGDAFTSPKINLEAEDDTTANITESEPAAEKEAFADGSDLGKDEDADGESDQEITVLEHDNTKLAGKTNCAAGAKGGLSAPSTKRASLTTKKTPRQRERELIRAKREQEKQDEKRRRVEEKDKLRKEKQDQKEKERREREEKREKERKEKEEKKERERQDKEKEKIEKQKQREAEKQKLVEEKRQAKEEEKRKAEEEEQRKLQKAKSVFSIFFVKKSKENESEQEEVKEEENRLFQQFRVKEDMVLAPGARTALSERQCRQLEAAVAAVGLPSAQLYLAELRSGRRQPQTRSRTLPPLQKDLEIIEEDDEDRELDCLAQNIELCPATRRRLRYKLLMFHENRRPAYWGTWSKRSRDVTGRRPLGKAPILSYDEDSDDDWEEEDPNGESLSGSEKEVESEDDYEVDNEYFVPHGYLSDEEMKDEEEMVSPEAQKARLKEKVEEFEKQMKRKTTALKPRLIGCVWQDDTNTDPTFQQLLKLLQPFAARPLSALPVPMVASERAGPALTGPSPADTPASAQLGHGYKFLKKFPDEALLPLARLVHGSTRGKPLLVREFATFWKRRANGLSPRKQDSAASPRTPQTETKVTDTTPTGTGGPLLSKKKIEEKLCDIATYSRCTAEGPLQGRCCWLVRDDVLEVLGTQLPLPSQWKWITKTAAHRRKGTTPGVPPAAASELEAALERPRTATLLITKFAKVVTAEEARSDLLNPPPAKRKIVPKLISPDAPAAGPPTQPGITNFFKTSPTAATLPPASTASACTAAADGRAPSRRLAPTQLAPRPGQCGVPARRLVPTPVADWPCSAAAGPATPARRLTPTAVPVGPPAARRVTPRPVPAGSAVANNVTLISLPQGLPKLAEAAAAPVVAGWPMPTAPASGNVETITLD